MLITEKSGNMKKKVIAIIVLLIISIGSGASQAHHGKYFKAKSKDSKVKECRTYSDVKNHRKHHFRF
jgi:hypothetical protein